MTFHFHINSPTEQITIHVSECAFCKNGKGIHNNSGTNNSIWYGHFLNLKDTISGIDRINNKLNYNLRYCTKCLGSYNKIKTPIPLIKDNLIFNYVGVYKIFLFNKSSHKPIKLKRLISIDNSGTIYIGCSNQKGGVSSRLKQFISNKENKNKNYHTAGHKIANNKNLNLFINKYDLRFTVTEEKFYKVAENNLLQNYKNSHGEVPPLNG